MSRAGSGVAVLELSLLHVMLEVTLQAELPAFVQLNLLQAKGPGVRPLFAVKLIRN